MGGYNFSSHDLNPFLAILTLRAGIAAVATAVAAVEHFLKYFETATLTRMTGERHTDNRWPYR